MKKNIIAAIPGGISNRIKCLISMWRISDKYKKNLFIYWVRNNQCGAEFNKLFENDFKIITKEELDLIKDKIVSQTHRLIVFEDEIKDGFAKVFPTNRGNNIDFEFNRIPINVRENILTYLNRLKPIEVIRNVVDNFSIKYDIENLVGIHIRRDDFILCGDEKNSHVSSDNKFIEKMNELIKKDINTKFFLCTDCKLTEDKFKEIFGNKIIIYPKKSRERTSILATQQSLVDLLLLSKTKHIIGTYRSTFNELAWWIGNCRAKVDIIIDDEFKKQYEEKKKKLDKSKYLKLKVLLYKILCKVRVFKK